MKSIPPTAEDRFIRDVEAGVKIGKWLLPMVGALVVGAFTLAGFFYSMVSAQNELSRRVSSVESARATEASERKQTTKERTDRLEQQSRDIAVLMAMVADIRDAVRDMRDFGEKKRRR